MDNSVNIHLTGSGWSGVGLNLEGYWPAEAGQKRSDYKFLLLDIKTDGRKWHLSCEIQEFRDVLIKFCWQSFMSFAMLENINRCLTCLEYALLL
ncbi:MAG TPA: hypothetical protein DET40_03905 [Lentisphaeria bacterium]|nr:MAG: hypothetical protein A2X45_15300 [Lentisphaerae bacterium GWF2_50_93]HCE42670.1 hypothetical protein [Lentisphaeria bacterium]